MKDPEAASVAAALTEAERAVLLRYVPPRLHADEALPSSDAWAFQYAIQRPWDFAIKPPPQTPAARPAASLADLEGRGLIWRGGLLLENGRKYLNGWGATDLGVRVINFLRRTEEVRTEQERNL